MAIWSEGTQDIHIISFSASFCICHNHQHHHHLPFIGNPYATSHWQLDYPSASLDRQVFTAAHKTRMSLFWVNDRVGGPCQPGAWTRALSTLQFTPSGQEGRGGRRNDEADDRRNEAVNQMSAKTKKTGRETQRDRFDSGENDFISHLHFFLHNVQSTIIYLFIYRCRN